MSRHRKVLFGTTLGLYAVIVLAVLVRTDLVRLDWHVMLFRPYRQWPEVHAFLDYFVVMGQRGPTAVLVAAWLGWRSWRQRTLRPLLVLGSALLALNATVGAVKIGLGRLGPHYATSIGSAELFQGGDIFPSGHTANAVVTWGVLAYLATTPRARRVLSVVAAVFALGVGATTVYLGTHWVSDVLLGWAAGLLILFGLPWCEPGIVRAEALIFALREQWRTRRAGAPDGRPLPRRCRRSRPGSRRTVRARPSRPRRRPPGRRRAPTGTRPGRRGTRERRQASAATAPRRPLRIRGGRRRTAAPLRGGRQHAVRAERATTVGPPESGWPAPLVWGRPHAAAHGAARAAWQVGRSAVLRGP